MSNRPVRHTGVLARDQILAWQLQNQNQRCGHSSNSHGSKAQKASKAVTGGKAKQAISKTEPEVKSNEKCEKKVHNKPKPEEKPQAAAPAPTPPSAPPSINDRRMRMAIEARIRRTLAIAEQGMEKAEQDPSAKKTPMHVTLCPADDWHKGPGAKSLGPLQNSNLSTSSEATIIHLKQFLVNKLAPNLQVSDVIIACRGLVLQDDQLVRWVKKYIWPSTHPLPPVLRYRLRGCSLERVPTLAHTGDILRDPTFTEPSVRFAGSGQRVSGAGSGSGTARGGMQLSWVEQYPSDFVYNQNFVRAGGAAAATTSGGGGGAVSGPKQDSVGGLAKGPAP